MPISSESGDNRRYRASFCLTGAGREQVQVRPVEWDEQTGERRGMFAEFRIDSGMIGNRPCICAGKSAIKRLWIMAGSTLVCLLASQPSCDW